MGARGTRGAYRKEERARLPPELQKELVERAARRYGNCQELAKTLDIPKSSVHYYKTGRLTMPVSLLQRMLREAADDALEAKIMDAAETLDRTWANYHSSHIMREMCREKLRLPTKQDLERDDGLRRSAAAIVSYVMAEGSVWLQKEKWGECAVNITFAEHETDLYEHFRGLCREVFLYDIGPPQLPGNGARAIRGFIHSRFVAEWLIDNCVPQGEKSAKSYGLPAWVWSATDEQTWRAALQPWCDGEGSVMVSGNGKPLGFMVCQSAHTDLDMCTLPLHAPDDWNRRACLSDIRGIQVFGMSAAEYLTTTQRSRILDELKSLFRKLELDPVLRIRSLYLKDDGFWSCIWGLCFNSGELRIMRDQGLITQRRKLYRAGPNLATYNKNIFI